MNREKDVQLDWGGQLVADTAFVNVLEHDHAYLSDAINFFNKGHFENSQVDIAIFAMQDLEPSEYVQFCNALLTLFNENKITEGVVEEALTPDFLNKRIIIDNYNNADVKALLQTFQHNKKITDKDFRNFLPDILSGKSSVELKKLEEESASN